MMIDCLLKITIFDQYIAKKGISIKILFSLKYSYSDD